MTGLGHRPPVSGLSHLTTRALLSALAGGLTAAGFGGPLCGGALGAGGPTPSPSTAEGSATSPVTLAPGASAQEPGAGGPSTSSSPSPSTTAPAPLVGAPSASAPSEVLTVVSQRRQKTTTGRNVAHTKPKRDQHRRGQRDQHRRGQRRHGKTTRARRITGGVTAPQGAAAIGLGRLAPAPAVAADQVGALAALTDLEGLTASSAQALSFYRIPPFLLPIYHAAAVQFGVPWQILAAINEVETDYGNDQSVSSAGAVGWMQFMPATWTQFGVDALDTGYADPYNPVDAIFAAARYLRAAGAASDLPAAIFAYNHSAAYVSSVLLRAKLISAYPESVITTLTCLGDGRPPVTGRMAWESLAPAASASSSATADRASAARATALAPTEAAAAAVGTRAPRFVELRSAPHASVVAVQSGRIVGLGHSRKLGFYVILRDAHGDVFTYAGLGSIASSYTRPETSRRSRGARHVGLRLRRGSFVAQGTVLGRVRVPRGAKDGHLRFAIRPAGDPDTIDPRPILASWALLNAAVRLPAKQASAQGGADLLDATTTTTTSDVLVLSKHQLERDLNRILIGPHPTGATTTSTGATRLADGTARSASSSSTAPSLSPASGHLSTAQWNRLIAQVGALRAPTVAVKPSSRAISDAGQREDDW